MASPPTITTSATATAGLTTSYVWNAATGNVFNFYSGIGVNSAGFRATTCTTTSGTRTGGQNRIEVNVDAAKVSFQVFDLGTSGTIRFIIDGQYATLTPTASGLTGSYYVTLDFSAVGGRAVRNIIMESTILFRGASVGPLEGVYKPGGDVLRAIVVGDSYTAGAGASTSLNGFGWHLSDHLGIRDMCNNGIGSTGYLATAGGTQNTIRQRLSDMTYVAPDLAIICGGHNDTTNTAAAVQAEVTTYLTTLRATPALARIPVFVFGVFAGNSNANAAYIATETAIAAAVTAVGDARVYYIPANNDVNGPWFTGTGATNLLHNDGNCDLYITTDQIHPNDAGHAFLGARCADGILRVLNTNNL